MNLSNFGYCTWICACVNDLTLHAECCGKNDPQRKLLGLGLINLKGCFWKYKNSLNSES